MLDFAEPKSISLSKSRWTLTITIRDAEDREHVYKASADSGYTDGDGIYFGTLEEYEEDASW